MIIFVAILLLVVSQLSIFLQVEKNSLTQHSGAETTALRPPPPSYYQDKVVLKPYTTTNFVENINSFFEDLENMAPSNQTAWIREYLIWHQEVRRQFPDTELLLSSSNRLLIAWYHPDHRGGLTDRTKCLADFLYTAYKEKRILLIKWYQAPLDLEIFLEPHLMNFTLPMHATTQTKQALQAAYGKKHATVKLVRLKSNSCREFQSPFALIWHALFRPTPIVQQAIDTTLTTYHLVPDHFDAVHCRVTHPAFWGRTSFDANQQAMDSQGAFQFTGQNRAQAIQAAIHGIQCARNIGMDHAASKHQNAYSAKNSTRPSTVYFFSDSLDLVKAMVTEGDTSTNPDASSQSQQDVWSKRIKKLQSKAPIVGRFNTPVAHLLNRQPDTPVDAFVSTFVDIYVASKARCLGLGVGNYAYLAAQIKLLLASEPICWVRHQEAPANVAKHWGMLGANAGDIPSCKF